jgi:hypothetical protein
LSAFGIFLRVVRDWEKRLRLLCAKTSARTFWRKAIGVREIRVSGTAREELHIPAGTGCAFELRKRVIKIPPGEGKHKKKRPALRAGR